MIVVTHTIRHLSGVLGERWGGLLAGLLGLGATVAFAVATARCLNRSRGLALTFAAGAATYVVAALLVRGVGDRQTALGVLLSLGLIAAGHGTLRGLRGRVRDWVPRRRLSPAWKLLLR